MEKIVVIGAGQAGSSLVAKLRNEGFDGRVTLLGAEPAPPYQRPPLSKAYLLGEMERERLFLRPAQFYTDQEIDLRLGICVKRVDLAAKTLSVGTETLPFDQLAFTTGARARTVPAAIGGDLEGVLTVRDLADVDRMEPYVTRGGHVLIVGGGYIGLEAAAVARKKGLSVTLIEMADRILQRVACPETAAYFKELHEDKGVSILENTGLIQLKGERHVARAVLSTGQTLDVDFVIAGIGIEPNQEIAEAAGITCAGGIATNAMGETSAPGVWAAGDCATLPWEDKQIRLESVQNAIDQAEAVAKNMLGSEIPYDPKPWFWSDQYDMKLQIAGLNQGYTSIVTRQSADARSHWYYRGDTLISVDAINDPRGYMVGKRLIEAGKSPDPSALANPDTELKALLRA